MSKLADAGGKPPPNSINYVGAYDAFLPMARVREFLFALARRTDEVVSPNAEIRRIALGDVKRMATELLKQAEQAEHAEHAEQVT